MSSKSPADAAPAGTAAPMAAAGATTPIRPRIPARAAGISAPTAAAAPTAPEAFDHAKVLHPAPRRIERSAVFCDGLNRHCEPTGRRKAPPDDRLREAIHLAAERKHGLLRRFAPRNDGREAAQPSRRHRLLLHHPM